MRSIRQALFIIIAMIGLVVGLATISSAQAVNYTYDELNRLKQVDYGDGNIIEYIYDNSGNRISVGPVDTTPPTGTIIINSGAASTTNTAVTLTLSCSDASGCSQMQFSNDNVTYSAPEAYATTKAWTLTTGPGTNTVYVKFKDTAGNWSTAYSDTIEFTGWLFGWSYRKSVTLSRASGAVSNYQMKLSVGETSGAPGKDVDCGGHIRSDFNDLRFTNSNGDLLNYWIESITGTTPNRLATVWVKVDAIGTSATTFYMYYGNSGATAYSNGDNTFTFFDDFSGSAVNGDKWSQYKTGSSTITVESGLAKVKAVAGTSNGWVACILYTKAGISWARPFAIRVKWKENDTPSSWAQLNPIAIYKDAANQIGFERYSNNYRYWRKIIGGTSTYVTSEMWANDLAYHISDFAFRTADWSAWIDGIQKVNANSENTLTTGFTLRLQPQEYYANQICEYWVDYVFVRNYVSSGPEPAWGSWGAEQTN